MQKILDHILPENTTLIKYGQLDDKVLLELKMTTSLYDYIQVITNYYDDDERPYINSWTDIEGFGYGWLWMNHDEKDWHREFSKFVGREADRLIDDMDNTLYFIYEDHKVKTFHFVSLNRWREDTIIDFSNEEMYW